MRFDVRGGEQRGHLLFAGDERAQAIIGRSEFALHQDEGRVGAGARVVVGVFLPGADGFEREQLRTNVGENNFAVAARDKVGARSRRDRWLRCALEFLQRGDLGVDGLCARSLRVACRIGDSRPSLPLMERSGNRPGRSIRRRLARTAVSSRGLRLVVACDHADADRRAKWIFHLRSKYLGERRANMLFPVRWSCVRTTLIAQIMSTPLSRSEWFSASS